MTTHYESSSRGAVEIASMNYNHAVNARDKLARADTHGLRSGELAALNSHIASLEAEQTAEAQVNG